MKYIVDHDMHIHSKLSVCSDDPLQTKENILQYAVKNNFKKIIITDHFWDKPIKNTNEFYDIQDFEHISQILPLPQNDNVEFLFGCETDMDSNMNIGILKETCDKFHFVIVPTTHMHMYVDKSVSLAERAKIYVKRFEKLLESDLPFHKIGIAHLVTPIIADMDWESHIKVIDSIDDNKFFELFGSSKELGCGIELNMPIFKYKPDEIKRIMRPFVIAKECGCKFYFGSDAHHPNDFDRAKEGFEYVVELLNLTEDDKFVLLP